MAQRSAHAVRKVLHECVLAPWRLTNCAPAVPTPVYMKGRLHRVAAWCVAKTHGGRVNCLAVIDAYSRSPLTTPHGPSRPCLITLYCPRLPISSLLIHTMLARVYLLTVTYNQCKLPLLRLSSMLPSKLPYCQPSMRQTITDCAK